MMENKTTPKARKKAGKQSAWQAVEAVLGQRVKERRLPWARRALKLHGKANQQQDSGIE